jgi:hypothetical protein
MIIAGLETIQGKVDYRQGKPVPPRPSDPVVFITIHA